MHPPGADVVLVRHGEIGVKSLLVQRSMEDRLRQNLAALLADRDVDGDVVREHSRLYVHTDESSVEASTEAAADAFGVVSASPARAVEPAMAAITDALAATARTDYDGGRFAVRARRAGDADEHAFTSQELAKRGGEAVWNAAEAEGYDPTVDLDDPDWSVFVEARPDRAYVFREKRPGPGGLPLGCQDPLVALVSGGIDSPVAAWLAMKRGSPVVPLYVDLGDYGGADHRARAAATADDLARYAPNADLDLRVAAGGPGIDRLVAEMDSFRMLGLRRFMLVIAEHVAEDLDAVGIVTGESLGQKSSQTAANLRVTAAATDLPVHQPLLAMDKPEITERAREIGTFEDATISAGCNRIVPDHPATAATLERVREAEPDELATLAAEAADEVTFVEPGRE